MFEDENVAKEAAAYDRLELALTPLGLYHRTGDPVTTWYTPFAGPIDYSATAPDRVVEYTLIKIRETGFADGRMAVQRDIRYALGLDEIV